MKLHRTPVHYKALDLVRREQVTWREACAPKRRDGVPRASSGFVYVGGRLPSLDVLVALYEMRRAGLLCIDDGVVALTLAGEQQLSESGVTRAVKS